MPWTSEHTKWFVNNDEHLKTADGMDIEVWEFCHQKDEAVLSAWAKHFRNHYCLDTDIDILRDKLSRGDYLTNRKFPSITSKLGPSIRAGDFGEILVADYLQWILGCWVPRVRWSSKIAPDESPKGSDVIGFQFCNKNCEATVNDILFVFECKTKFSNSSKNRLQEAINDSAKDHIRIDESLNFIRQKLYERRELEQVQRIGRFQNPVDTPYRATYGAAAIISNEYFDANVLTTADCSKIPNSTKSMEFSPHPNIKKLVLLVIKGQDMMELVHELYRRAAYEA